MEGGECMVAGFLCCSEGEKTGSSRTREVAKEERRKLSIPFCRTFCFSFYLSNSTTKSKKSDSTPIRPFLIFTFMWQSFPFINNNCPLTQILFYSVHKTSMRCMCFSFLSLCLHHNHFTCTGYILCVASFWQVNCSANIWYGQTLRWLQHPPPLAFTPLCHPPCGQRLWHVSIQQNAAEVKESLWSHFCDYIRRQCPSCWSVSLLSGFEEGSCHRFYSCEEQKCCQQAQERGGDASLAEPPSEQPAWVPPWWDPEGWSQLSQAPDPWKLTE